MVTWDEAEKIFAATDPKFEAWSPSQRGAYLQWGASLKRQLLFFPTGEGKTKTALAEAASRGHKHAVIIAPLAAQGGWAADAKKLGMDVLIHTHQKFLRPDTSYKDYKESVWIVDEFHMFGGHGAKGWGKFNRMMRTFKGDLIMCSATPNYNDAERVFCLTAIGDEAPNRNYLDWLWDNCNCHINRFSRIPDVDEETPFKNYDSAIDFLRSRPWVSWVEDKAQWHDRELVLPSQYDDLFVRYNVDRRNKKLMNSQMEKNHRTVDYAFIGEDGKIRPEVMGEVSAELAKYPDRIKWMVFCYHKTVAQALKRTVPGNTYLIDGDTPKKNVDPIKMEFINADGGWLIGTTAIATGMDGVDKVCTSMLILDDINGDGSLRRQLIGRILPRGAADHRPRLVVTATF